MLTTDDQSTIDRLTQAVGFQYVYDAAGRRLRASSRRRRADTPAATISRYIYGMDFSANDLRLGLVEAAADRIGTLVDQVLLICYHYDPLSGRYTPLVDEPDESRRRRSRVLVVGGALFLLWRADLRRGSELDERTVHVRRRLRRVAGQVDALVLFLVVISVRHLRWRSSPASSCSAFAIVVDRATNSASA